METPRVKMDSIATIAQIIISKENAQYKIRPAILNHKPVPDKHGIFVRASATW